MRKLQRERTNRKCRRTGKRSFPTELDAKMEMANNPNLKRTYPCGDHFHTTSRKR